MGGVAAALLGLAARFGGGRRSAILQLGAHCLSYLLGSDRNDVVNPSLEGASFAWSWHNGSHYNEVGTNVQKTIVDMICF
jgi:hypothetical protein